MPDDFWPVFIIMMIVVTHMYVTSGGGYEMTIDDETWSSGIRDR